MKPKQIAASSLVLVLAACGGTSETSQHPTQKPTAHVSSGTELERFFPLVDGNIYHYKTELLVEGPAEPAGTLIVKVRRTSPTQGQLLRPTAQDFSYASNGIATTTKSGAPAFLMKWPIDSSQTWLGPQGGQTRYDNVNATINTPAGTFQGCVVTIETRGGDLPVRVATTLCPTVGIVALEVQQAGAVERAELVYYGEPIDIGPDGLTTNK
ncbi:MAG: hypothetical protein U0271_18520 [Polyangiaceae bacterium]